MATQSFGGQWTGDKLEILRQYLDKYTTALKNQQFNLIYVDAFAGDGSWSPKSSYTAVDYADFQELRRGSSRIALEVTDKPFDRLVFIEKDSSRISSLQTLQSEFSNRHIEIVNSDANTELPKLCQNLSASDRAVVFLDPFATEVDWHTVEAIASTEKIDCWILFPRMAIARMMPRSNEPTPALAGQLDRIFGGRDYWSGLYHPSPQLSLFGDGPKQERQDDSEVIAALYRKRLESVFARVAPTERTLRNSKDSPMFDLFFAASSPRGASIAICIADHILNYW